MHAIAINYATVTFPLLMLYLQIIFFDGLIDRLRPVDLVLFTLLLELVNLNLNVKKYHTEFLWKPFMLYCTVYVTGMLMSFFVLEIPLFPFYCTNFQ